MPGTGSHDFPASVWEIWNPFPRRHKTGRPATITGLSQCRGILRTGAPWRDLPPDYGDWKNTHRRFCRWRDRGVWAKLLDAMIDDPDFEWLMIDASYIKTHPHSAGRPGAAIKPLPAQKGAQHQAALGGGCPRNAGKSDSHRRHGGATAPKRCP